MQAQESRTASELDVRFLAQPAFSVFAASVRDKLGARAGFPRYAEFFELCAGLASSIAPWFEFIPEEPERVRALGGFDRFIAKTSAIPTRTASYHDLFGALIWLHFPALKTALHRAHLLGGGETRSPLENAAMHLDESGVLVISSECGIF